MAVYKQYFGHFYSQADLDHSGQVTEQAFKRVAQERVIDKLEIYLKHLFDCDYLLWTWLTPRPGFAIFERGKLPKIAWDPASFSFTQTPGTWNESCTVKYRVPGAGGRSARPVPIAEYQIHNHRSNFKFRVNLRNLQLVFETTAT